MNSKIKTNKRTEYIMKDWIHWNLSLFGNTEKHSGFKNSYWTALYRCNDVYITWPPKPWYIDETFF